MSRVQDNIREPQQDRSARTRAQLLDATERLLHQDGLDGFTIARVAKEAGCSVGSVYHHFQDKRTIIYAVLDRFSREIDLTAKEELEPSRWQGVSLMDILDRYLRFSLNLYRRFPGTLYAQRSLALQDPEVGARVHASNRSANKRMMRLLRPHFAEIGHPNPALAVSMTLEMLKALLVQRSYALLPRAGHTGTIEQKHSEKVFIAEALRMVRRYLEIQDS